MTMREGFIKLYRSLGDSQVFAHQTALKIWIWCLIKASHKDRFVTLKVGKGDIIIPIKAGQFIFGRMKAEEELNIDGSTIYKWMQKFSSENFGYMIKLNSNNQYTVVTICNWVDYQDKEVQDVTTIEQPSNSGVTAEEQLRNTDNNVNNVDNVNNDIYPFEKFWNDYDKKVGVKSKLEKKFNKLSLETKLKIKDYLPKYKEAQPDKQYRKNPETFLNQQSWNDELIPQKPILQEPAKRKHITIV